jgi:hypothetical protein
MPSTMKSLLLLSLDAAVLFALDRPIVLKTATLCDSKGKALHNTIICRRRIKNHEPRRWRAGQCERIRSQRANSDAQLDRYPRARRLSLRYQQSVRGSDWPASQPAWHITENFVATLNAGFTTIQSPGAIQDKDLRDAVARGMIPGPRILTSLDPLTERAATPR